ncbi:alpha/beta fold hydrolase [Paramicrobacterium agarici]|uniref:Pimeloyl-ACP methyl ester carboxylesterase n=1 Tax=Paramicrobacterium agarici TaxID=630514 RepID=A0A2A9DSW2_9MICO|nr:alpha/beta hydrolase [Microbacterium agarici]PFG29436.1 pimeloyl-ACP methyl ester carboxylesterase [Microbacterium agarici]
MNTFTPIPLPSLVDMEGSRIATTVLQPTEREPRGDVVLCHGTPWSSTVWAPIAQALSADYRVFLWDMPGYGKSIAQDAPSADLVSQRKRFASLIDHWQLDRPHVIAHDIGGAVALGAHVLEGVDYASLYLMDTVTLDPWGSAFFRLVADNRNVFSALPPTLHAALVRAYIAGAGGPRLDPGWIDALSRPWKSAVGQTAFYQQIAQLSPDHTTPIVERLATVRCRTRIAWGASDPWIDVEQATRLASLLPGTPDVVVFPEVGHLLPLEAADDLAADVGDWLCGSGARVPAS